MMPRTAMIRPEAAEFLSEIRQLSRCEHDVLMHGCDVLTDGGYDRRGPESGLICQNKISGVMPG